MPKACVSALRKKTNPSTKKKYTAAEAHKICYSKENKKSNKKEKSSVSYA